MHNFDAESNTNTYLIASTFLHHFVEEPNTHAVYV